MLNNHEIHGFAESKKSLTKEFRSFRVVNSENHLVADIGGLFSLDYDLDSQGLPLAKVNSAKVDQSWLGNVLNGTEDGSLVFSVNGFSHSWEARYTVVQNYLSEVNRLTGRNSELSMNDIQKHWRRKLVLPLEICGDLTNEEYAVLVEKLPPESPIQVQAKAVRYYPENYLASHVFGYVGSGYEANFRLTCRC